ncbi:hypothetical protein [Streptomyces sp. NBC_00078]|uniref:hypothetical protein n=1 Tax=unclassified Streptomyces TaxID=2593676 RepID=UPI0022528D07|nr:hypothetical protein [Streptomyces sp. NBC_00078]MCX5420562.1 hypothetical protein [Streptomyces sp. NBC_00078]
MSSKKSTVRAAKAQIERDTKNVKQVTPEKSKGSLADQPVRAHTLDLIEVEDSHS